MGCRLLFFLTVLLVGGEIDMRAQGCCSVGASSLGGLESSIQPFQTLRIGANYQYNAVTQAYRGIDLASDPRQSTASVGYFMLDMEYGFEQRFSLLASILYSDKERTITITSRSGNERFPQTASFRGVGFGDLTLLTKYQLVSPSILNPLELSLGGGATLPTGSFRKEQDGAELSIDLQPGTGAPTLIGWFLVRYGLLADDLHLAFSGQYRYASPNFNGYRLGDELLGNLGGEIGVSRNFAAALYLHFRFADRDFIGGRVLLGTGGTYYDVMPSVLYIDGPSTVRVFGQLPLYRNVRGIQLALTYMIGVEYRYIVKLSGEE